MGQAAGVDHQGHQEIPLALPGHAHEALGDAEAGVVDQDVDVPAAVRDGLQDRPVRLELSEVGGQRDRHDALLDRQLLRQRLQPVESAGHQHHVAASLGVGSGERLADPR
jgi:hypothetical protein